MPLEDAELLSGAYVLACGAGVYTCDMLTYAGAYECGDCATANGAYPPDTCEACPPGESALVEYTGVKVNAPVAGAVPIPGAAALPWGGATYVGAGAATMNV